MAPKRNRNLLLVFILAIIPLIAIAVFYVVKSGMLTDDSVKASVMERWPNGSVKLTSRDWFENGKTYEEFCHFDTQGKSLGCGIRIDDAPWDGTFITWYYSDLLNAEESKPMGQIRYTQTYAKGKSQGTWKTYYPDGSPSSEVVFKDGKRISWIIWNVDGSVINKGTSNALPSENSKKETR